MNDILCGAIKRAQIPAVKEPDESVAAGWQTTGWHHTAATVGTRQTNGMGCPGHLCRVPHRVSVDVLPIHRLTLLF